MDLKEKMTPKCFRADTMHVHLFKIFYKLIYRVNKNCPFVSQKNGLQ